MNSREASSKSRNTIFRNTREMVLFQIRSSSFILVFNPSSQSTPSHMRTAGCQKAVKLTSRIIFFSPALCKLNSISCRRNKSTRDLRRSLRESPSRLRRSRSQLVKQLNQMLAWGCRDGTVGLCPVPWLGYSIVVNLTFYVQ